LSQQNSVLNNNDAYANLLQLLLSRKQNDELQEDLVELVGFEHLLLIEDLLAKREFIQDYCGKLLKEKEQVGTKGPKTHDSRPQVGVSVSWGKNNKKGNGRRSIPSKGFCYPRTYAALHTKAWRAAEFARLLAIPLRLTNYFRNSLCSALCEVHI